MGKLQKYLRDVLLVRKYYHGSIKKYSSEDEREEKNIGKIDKIISAARDLDYDELPTKPDITAKFGDDDDDEDEDDDHPVKPSPSTPLDQNTNKQKTTVDQTAGRNRRLRPRLPRHSHRLYRNSHRHQSTN